MKGLALAAIAGLVGLGAPQPAQAQTPLKATFRCANSATCPGAGIPDTVQSDGVVEHGVTFDGFRTWTVKKTTYLDGAFVNSAGGIDINLIPEGTVGDRALTFRFGSAVATFGTVPSACQPASVITATDVDFRFNVTDGSNQNIDQVPAGGSVSGVADSSGRRVIGVVNFALGPSASGALFFNNSKDSIAPWDGQSVTLTRSADGHSYVLGSSGSTSVLLQCTLTNKGKSTTYNVGTYDVPFQLTVVTP